MGFESFKSNLETIEENKTLNDYKYTSRLEKLEKEGIKDEQS